MGKEPTNAEILKLAEKCLYTPAEPCLEIDAYNNLLTMLTPQTVINLIRQFESAAETNRIAALAVGELEGRLEATEARLGAMLSALEIPPTGMALKPQELAEICRQITVAAKCGVHTPLHGLHKLVGDEELEATLKEQVK